MSDPDSPIDQSKSSSIAFRVPPSARLAAIVVMCVVLIVIGVVISSLLWVGLGYILFGHGSMPTWWHVAASATVFAVLFVLLRQMSRSMPSRLILSPEHLRLEGLLFRRTIQYENIKIVHLHRTENVVAVPLCELRIQPHRGSRASIHLRETDVDEVFATLRAFCVTAEAIHEDDTSLARVRQVRDPHRRRAIAKDYRRRVVIAVLVSIGSGATAVVILGMLVFSSTPPQPSRGWKLIAGPPLICLGAIIYAFRMRAIARQIEIETDNRNDL